MPAIAPFQGLRFNATGKALGNRLAPPYDVISPELRDRLAALDPHGIVHLILDKELAGDAPGHDRYSRAAHRLAEWVSGGVLMRDPAPALYPLEQSFVAPDGRERIRRGVMAAVRLHDVKERVVRGHEATLAGALADRLELLRNVRTDLSPVFGLYDDVAGAVVGALAGAFARDPVADAVTEDGTRQRLWRVTDPAVVSAVQKSLLEKRVLIADGHHRYGAALAYRDEIDRVKPGLPADGGHRYTLMFLMAKSDPGLVIFPTHRALSHLGIGVPELLSRLEPHFRVEPITEDVRRPTGRAWAISRLTEHMGKSSAFLMVTAADRQVRLVTLRDDARLEGLPLPAEETLRALDVSILHGVILEGLLGVPPAPADGGRLHFLRDAGEAVNRTLNGEFEAAFVVNPTPMWQVQAVADAGRTMPQKSTWFHPQIPSGLVLRQVDPNGPP